MSNFKKVLFVLALTLAAETYTSYGQIEVRVRPHRPHVVRVQAPSPRHVWIDEEWEPQGDTYVFRGGRWEEPPRHGARWAPGHWKHRGHGEIWISGHWR